MTKRKRPRNERFTKNHNRPTTGVDKSHQVPTKKLENSVQPYPIFNFKKRAV